MEVEGPDGWPNAFLKGESHFHSQQQGMTVPLATKITRFMNILLKISPESEGVRGDRNDTDWCSTLHPSNCDWAARRHTSASVITLFWKLLEEQQLHLGGCKHNPMK